jgi:hypothetical protein
MEQISFRTSMTVLGGVVAVAAVIAAVTVLTNQAPAPSRPVALSPSSASHSAPTTPSSAPATPPTPAASPSRTAPEPSAPARTQGPAASVPEPAYPATAGNSTPSRDVPAAISGHSASVQRFNSALAAWAAWWRARLSRAGGVHSGFGGFGSGGHGAGHR